jgi:putative ABC transport system ATP-binding protein
MPAAIERHAVVENDAIYIPTYDFWGETEFERLEHCRHSPMLKTAQYTSYRLAHKSPSHFRAPRINLSVTKPLASIHSSPERSPIRKDYKMTGNRKNEVPRHEMVHFAGLLNTERRFGDFRTVLHTGLYSQLVAMEVPVDGEIGDEVSSVSC